MLRNTRQQGGLLARDRTDTPCIDRRGTIQSDTTFLLLRVRQNPSGFGVFTEDTFILFLESIKNIYFSSRNFILNLSAVELSGTFFGEKKRKPVLGIWVQPQSPLVNFMLENPRNERFRSVSGQEKNPGTFFCPDGGEIFGSESGRSS